MKKPLLPAQPITDVTDPIPPTFYIKTKKVDFIKIAILGALVGALTPLLDFTITKFFVEPVFCQSANSFGACTDGGANAYYAAAAIVTILAIVVMVSWQTFRPLLIAVVSLVALWGFKRYMQDALGQNGLEYYLLSALSFASCYTLFFWLMRLRNFALSIIAAIIVSLTLHLLLVS